MTTPSLVTIAYNLKIKYMLCYVLHGKKIRKTM